MTPFSLESKVFSALELSETMRSRTSLAEPIICQVVDFSLVLLDP